MFSRVVIESVTPCVDCGRHPAKAIAGEEVIVEADVFTDGHDEPRAVLLYRRCGAAEWRESPMAPIGSDRYRGTFLADQVGRYVFAVCAWIDRFETWRHDLERRIAAHQDVESELLVAAGLARAGARPSSERSSDLEDAARFLESDASLERRIERALSEELSQLMQDSDPRERSARSDPPLCVVADPELARFSAWYELFPRSCGREGRHGTLRDVEERLPEIAAMGFDVLYLPPIHPIGTTLRKGRNNSPEAGPGDVGSPWGIGSSDGGHKTVHPELGTLEDLRSLVRAARAEHVEIALDVALQVSPDHPYVRSHPEWFRKRPDGTIQYAENPPKRYQDIYPFDFECDDHVALFEELKSIFDFWIEQGIRVFRVDNPHTKPFRFWEWCIGELKTKRPDLLFLSEAFTRPAVMYHLAKIGFSMSYTYFPWRTGKRELIEYFTELASPPLRHYFRPSHWPNTPDILPQSLQHGGRPSFIVRLVLAATLGTSYGIYGPAFELCEARPHREGGEEYLDSEKYELRRWEAERSESLAPLVARINRIRRENAALHRDEGLAFHDADNDALLAYSKRSADGNVVLCAVNLDPHHRQAGWVRLDCAALGLSPVERFQVHDLVTDARYVWQAERAYLDLDPKIMPVHVFRVRKLHRTEADFEYFL